MKKRVLLVLAVLVVLGSAGFAGSAEARTHHRSWHHHTEAGTTTDATTDAPPVVAPTPTAPEVPVTTPPVTPAPSVSPTQAPADGETLPVIPPAEPVVDPTPTPDPVVVPAVPSTPAPADQTTPPPTTVTPPPVVTPPPAVSPAPASGRWIGFYVPGVPSSMTALNTLESQIGAHASVVNFFVSDSENFPTPRCNNVSAAGATPLITLEFWSIQNSGGLAAINNGSKDAYIKKFADSAKAYGKTVWLRPFHEMNGDWYPWGTTGSNTSAQLVTAYRHVHDIFVAEGATNVKFVWCPNVDFKISPYYPGDAYVDYAAIDGYNNGKPWRSFSNVFGTTYNSVAAVSSKPIFLAETSCVEGGSGKAAWITDMFKQIDTKYTRIVGVCWFDASLTYDWRLETSGSSVNAFASALSAGY